MKTTIDVPDDLYRQIKVQAAENGQSIKSFFLEAAEYKLASGGADEHKVSGWQAVFGKANKGDVAEVQRSLHAEHRIDAEGWD
jgi:hypothetical protein